MREESVTAPERKWTTGELSYGGLRILFFFNVDYENFTHKIVYTSELNIIAKISEFAPLWRMKSNDIECQQPMLCIQKFNCRLAILMSIHFITFTFVAFIAIAWIRGFTIAI